MTDVNRREKAEGEEKRTRGGGERNVRRFYNKSHG